MVYSHLCALSLRDIFKVHSASLDNFPDYFTIVSRRLRNLLWATSKHDVYLMENYSVMQWSPLLRRGEELNVAKPIVPCLQLSGVQVSTMTVKENFLVAGGFQGNLFALYDLYLNQPGVAFCTKLTTDENAIPNVVDVYHNLSGAMRVMAANINAQIKIFDAESFVSVNSTHSTDGKLLAVLGDSVECLIVDAQSGKILAIGNQDTNCRLWDIRNLSKPLAVLKGRMRAIRGVKFTSEGRFLAMTYPADFVHIFDTKSGYVDCQEIDIFGDSRNILQPRYRSSLHRGR
ncbi:Glycosyl hydrolase family protein isoform 1 [Hibiscus syriacus]|uniref:Glycosyl hydrolase family protein isoform 1 n=1 Tax=Hibiscus syriacus TaxID=106335 RepID=A0A6A2YAY9_HIBSY|nr:Glycosyl hydrolase family protein isoform 1 [Hibiscus syriacus]